MTNTSTPIKSFKEYQELFIQKKFLACVKPQPQDKEPFTQIIQKPVFNIFEAIWGEGNPPIYIVTEPKTQLPLGQTEMCIEPLNIKENGLTNTIEILDESYSYIPFEPLKKIIRKWGLGGKLAYAISSGEPPKKAAFDILTNKPLTTNLPNLSLKKNQSKSVVFYKQTTPVDANEIIQLNNKQAAQLIEQYLYSGYETDQKIIYFHRTDILQADPNIIPENKYMPYAPHQIIITNTGTGKSPLSEKTGKKSESVSASRLLGFATADTVASGTLNGKIERFTIDEVEEEAGENLWGKILTLMQTGKTTIEKGKQSIICRSWSPIRLLANPIILDPEAKRDDYENEMAKTFEDFLNKITKNKKAISARIPILLFDDQIELAKGIGIDAEKEKELKKVYETIQKLARAPYSSLYLNNTIKEWLNYDYPREFKEQVAEFEKEIREQFFYEFADFLQGYQRGKGYLHVRGWALQQACVDNIMNIIKAEVDIQKLLADAQKHYKQILGIILNSLKNLTNFTKNQGLMRKIIKSHWSTLNDQQKILLKGFGKFCEEHEWEEQEYVWGEVLDTIVGIPEWKKTMSKNEFTVRIFNRWKAYNNELNLFGVVLRKRRVLESQYGHFVELKKAVILRELIENLGELDDK